MLSLGSELWFVFHDAAGPSYFARCVGTITAIRGQSYEVNGREWHEAAYPHFGNGDEARAWCAAHAPKIPTIK